MADPKIALYVSSVPGHVAFRPGTGTLIGAEFNREEPGNVRWFPDRIVAIPEAEYREYRSDYDRFLADKAIVKRDPPKPEEQPAPVAADTPTPEEDSAHGSR